MPLTAAIKLARPRHWVKNVIVLMPVIFAMRIGDAGAWAAAALAAAAFCLAAGAVYVVNDIADRQRDRLHPDKRTRPLAAGRVSLRAAAIEAGLLLAAALAVAAAVNGLVLAVVGAYVLLQAAYTFYLKRKMLLDVICIALGFVLRAVAGAVAIPVEPSPWLFICTFTLCLFLGFCKRCNELATLGETDNAHRHRPSLAGYRPELLTHLITLSAAVAVVAFLLYGASDMTVARIGTNYLVYTLPLVVYGVFRFAMLSMTGRYADPTDLILRDRPFELTIAVWLALAVAIVYWGRDIQDLARRSLSF